MPAHTTAEVKLAIALKKQAIKQGCNDAVSLRQCLEQAKQIVRHDAKRRYRE